jgi:hypothetical protein
MHKGALLTGGVLFMALAAVLFGQQIGNVAYRNPELPAEKRAAALVAQMTLEEKVLQMQNSAAAWRNTAGTCTTACSKKPARGRSSAIVCGPSRETDYT